MDRNWVFEPTYVGIGTLDVTLFAAAKFFKPSGGFLTALIGISSTIRSQNSK